MFLPSGDVLLKQRYPTYSRLPIRQSGGHVRFPAASRFPLRDDGGTERAGYSDAFFPRQALPERLPDFLRHLSGFFLGRGAGF
jgi:hypothetical protein